jgi:hypothetical protein
MLMTKEKMEQLVQLRKNIEHVMGMLEKIEQASQEFTQADGLTLSYEQHLKMSAGSPLRMLKLLHMRVTEIEESTKREVGKSYTDTQ